MTKMFFLSVLSACLLPLSAEAGPKFMSTEWYPSHWTEQDFIPYYDNGTEPHNTQWTHSTYSESQWKPEDWVAMDTGRGVDLIHKWYTVGILANQTVEGRVPYLDVGPNFYHLSGLDKRRVVALVDYVYQVTNKRPAMFYVRDSGTEKIIGYYTKSGLVLQ